jgi:polysaccharide pyruvyl transferase WcaK-like protein
LEQEKAAREIKDVLGRQAQIINYNDHWILIAILSELDLVITTKLHVGITSIAVKTPVVSFPYHSKTQRLYEQLNLSDRCIHVETLQKGQVNKQLNHFSSNISMPFEITAVVNNARVNKEIIQRFVNIEST